MIAPAERSRRLEELALALTLTVTVVTVRGSRLLQLLWQEYFVDSPIFTYRTFIELVLLVLGLIVALPCRRRTGLTLGQPPPSWWHLAAVVIPPALAVALVYPILPERPYAFDSRSMWLISPAAEELWFLGIIYGRLDAVFPDYVHRAVPIRQALPLTAAFFSLSHVALGLFSIMSPGFIAFQAMYTFAGCVFLGLSRQWTGSILYATAAHMAVNYVVWSVR